MEIEKLKLNELKALAINNNLEPESSRIKLVKQLKALEEKGNLVKDAKVKKEKKEKAIKPIVEELSIIDKIIIEEPTEDIKELIINGEHLDTTELIINSSVMDMTISENTLISSNETTIEQVNNFIDSQDINNLIIVEEKAIEDKIESEREILKEKKNKSKFVNPYAKKEKDVTTLSHNGQKWYAWFKLHFNGKDLKTELLNFKTTNLKFKHTEALDEIIDFVNED